MSNSEWNKEAWARLIDLGYQGRETNQLWQAAKLLRDTTDPVTAADRAHEIKQQGRDPIVTLLEEEHA